MSRRHHPHDGTPGPADPTPPPEIVKHVMYCFLHPNGPGHQLSVKVDELRGTLIRLTAGLALLIFLSTIIVGPLVVKWLTTKVGQHEDIPAVSTTAPKATAPKAAEPTETWGFPAVEAQPMLDHRYLPGVPLIDKPKGRSKP